MQSLIEKVSELGFTKVVKSVCQAYQEISVIRMQKSRSKVISIRLFLNSLSSVFSDVRNGEEGENVKNDEYGIVSKKEHVAVLISENSSLYGDLLKRIFVSFYAYIQANNCDVLVIGKQGLALYQRTNFAKPTTYFDLPEMNSEIKDIKHIVYFLIQYRRVKVFYGRFESVLTQEVIEDDVTGQMKQAEDPKAVKSFFVYEPSFKEIENFFETQVFVALFRQTLSESELARHASRIKMMEEALVRINEKEGVQRRQIRNLKKKVYDKKQMDRLSSIYKLNQ